MTGWRQRLKRRRVLGPEPQATIGNDRRVDVQSSKLASTYVKDWCWGTLSAPKLRKYILAQVEDEGTNVNSVLRTLAKSDEHNIKRHLVHCFSGYGFVQRIENILSSLVTDILPPHHIMNMLSKSRTAFEAHLGAADLTVLYKILFRNAKKL